MELAAPPSQSCARPLALTPLGQASQEGGETTTLFLLHGKVPALGEASDFECVPSGRRRGGSLCLRALLRASRRVCWHVRVRVRARVRV